MDRAVIEFVCVCGGGREKWREGGREGRREGANKTIYWGNPKNPQGAEEMMIPTDGVKWKLDGVVDSLSPDKGCEQLDGELTH